MDNSDKTTKQEEIASMKSVAKEKPAPVHADNDMYWDEGPSGEQVYIGKEHIEPIKTKIDSDYLKFSCGACDHDFWSYIERHIRCPKCRFPLELVVKNLVQLKGE